MSWEERYYEDGNSALWQLCLNPGLHTLYPELAPLNDTVLYAKEHEANWERPRDLGKRILSRGQPERRLPSYRRC